MHRQTSAGLPRPYWFAGKGLMGALMTASLLFAPVVAGEEISASGLLKSKLASLKTLAVTYHQRLGATSQKRETGTFYLQRPAQFRLVSDDQPLVVSDGDAIWEYDALLDQVKVKAFEGLSQWSPASVLLMKDNDLDSAFEVSVFAGEDQTHFLLKPIDPAALVKDISLSFAGSLPYRLAMTPKSGREVTIELTVDAVNEVLNPELFRFVPPVNVDVIDYRN